MECEKKQSTAVQTTCKEGPASTGPLARFERMIPNALEFVKEAKQSGRKIVGIFCEYTPRELFLAAEAVPVAMCGGQESTIAEAEKELPSNLCPLIKSSYGHARLKSNPFMEMADLLVAETTCDGKKKMYEILAQSRPIYVVELPQKWGSESAFDHWVKEIEVLKKKVEELTGLVIDHDSLRAAIEKMNRERDLRRQVAYLASSDPPLLGGREVLLAKSSVSSISCDIAAYEKIINWAEQRQNPYAGRPRILLTGVPCPHGAEKVIDIVEDSGGVIVAQENCSGLKPIMDNVSTEGDLLRNIARKYFDLPCSCMTPNPGRFELLSRLVEDFRPWGIIELVWQACHTYNVEAQLVRREAETRWELPYLKLETDYSPSDRAQLATRIETFLQLCTEKNSGKNRSQSLSAELCSPDSEVKQL